MSTHLDLLEAESIHIILEAIAEANNPVMLTSLGKDSCVLLHLARKAFYPTNLPFPLLHVDTKWKFSDMYRFRDELAKSTDLIVYSKDQAGGTNPFIDGSEYHTRIMKTEGLKEALNHYRFDVVFGGARRDEEKSRAKERIFSIRTRNHVWHPDNQRPELWNLYNTRMNQGESMRVFPLSNWTELDIWEYIRRENIQIVPLYFSQERPVLEINGMLIMVDDDRMNVDPYRIEHRRIRFRTLGCYPLTGATESTATTVEDIILELRNSKYSERQGRIIDQDQNSSMEQKKREGYF